MNRLALDGKRSFGKRYRLGGLYEVHEQIS